MSRSIEVRVSESVVRTVHVEDGVQSPLEILPVLANDRMADLLATELEKQGFKRDGDTMSRSDDDGVEIVVDLKNATVSVKLAADDKLAASVDLTSNTYEENEEGATKDLKVKAKKSLEDKVVAATEKLRQDVTARLEGKLGDIRAEIDTAIGRTTVAALTERAAQLGSVSEIASDDAGNVTIRVKLS